MVTKVERKCADNTYNQKNPVRAIYMINSRSEKAFFPSAVDFRGQHASDARWRRQHGFTLIELMIAMVIIGILATIAYPAYTGYVQEARRAEAKSLLFDAAQTLERRYTANSSYCQKDPCDPNSLEIKTEFYTVGLSSLTDTTYTLTATPKGSQNNDECGTFTLNQAGSRTPKGGDVDCW